MKALAALLSMVEETTEEMATDLQNVAIECRLATIPEAAADAANGVDPQDIVLVDWEYGQLKAVRNSTSDLLQGSHMQFYEMMTMPLAPPAATDNVGTGESEAAPRTQRRKVAPKPKQPNFSVPEDMTLVSCWLNVSLDPIIGAGRQNASFWKAIERNYNARKGAAHPLCTLRSLEGRWQDIKEQVGSSRASACPC
ncbi:hypothetical protein BAE44_0018091 [Dichanthelium oligosanthes]|uniref:No apical meristem-associated C-terminal domain-containing protein n=1 Tax=Dichanthelium oligosanthes TaxID=888268 RepID=A0A1E5V6V1_9POAL|nr:hypothetical protein BAE44_0018091 [Dichanthelium oligosanthes]